LTPRKTKLCHLFSLSKKKKESSKGEKMAGRRKEKTKCLFRQEKTISLYRRPTLVKYLLGISTYAFQNDS
jgi:hypothetical protein